MEYNLHLEPLCGEPYHFFKSRPDRYNQSVSRLDDYSRKDKQDKKLSLNEYKISVKPGETNAPEMTVLDSSDIICCKFLIPHQEDGQEFWVCIVKIIDKKGKS